MEYKKVGKGLWMVLIKRTSNGSEVWQSFKTKKEALEFIANNKQHQGA